MENDEYEEQAKQFLKNTGTEFSFKFLRNGLYFEDDKDARDIYEITLKRGDRSFIFSFGQSIACSGRFIVYDNGIKRSNTKILKTGIQCIRNKEFREPTAYDILACITKYPVEEFKDFCKEYGYDSDSRKAEKIFNAVKNEYENLERLFNAEELEMLRRIQ